MKPTVKDTGLRDVPHGRCLHDVPDHKLLDGLVLGDAAGAVGAADGLHVATALLGTTVVPPLLGLSRADVRQNYIKKKKSVLGSKRMLLKVESMGTRPKREYVLLAILDRHSDAVFFGGRGAC